MKRLIVVSMFALAAPVAMAQGSLTKQEIIDQSAAICRDLNEDVAPHVEGLNRAETRRGVLRHGRRFVRDSRPHIRDLADLVPSEGALRYRRYVNHTKAAVNWLDSALDALEAHRDRIADRRGETASEHAGLAKRAGRNYGLRRSCIRYVA